MSSVASETTKLQTAIRHYDVLDAASRTQINFMRCMEEKEFHIKIAQEKKRVGVMT